MKRNTLSLAKNIMRRALEDLVEPPPAEGDQRRLREYFGNACAYCGDAAPPRSAHLDHADPTGGNSLGNLVLACARCDGDEKREMHWEPFLRAKCGDDPVTFEARHTKIVAWRAANPAPFRQASADVQEARKKAELAIAAFEDAYNHLRSLVRRAR